MAIKFLKVIRGVRAPLVAAVLALLGLSLLASNAHAIPMFAGDEDIDASGEAKPIGGVIIAGGVPVPFVALTFNGTLTTTVLEGDTTNPYGGLTFLYQFSNNGPNSIDRFTIHDLELSNFLTDISYSTPADGFIVPRLQDRPTGDVIGFSFIGAPLGNGVISPGATSALLVVQTNAQFYKPLIANLIDGSTANIASFGPTVPEPSTLALAGMGAVGLALGIARRKFGR